MAFKAKRDHRNLGNHEIQLRNCHNKYQGALNISAGLTLVTRHEIDEGKVFLKVTFETSVFKMYDLIGLMKCSLQEFQHMFPHLTSRIKVKPGETPNSEESVHFVPMELPTLPLDTVFKTKNMLDGTFDEENGPLWRVQLVTEATMEAAYLVRK